MTTTNYSTIFKGILLFGLVVLLTFSSVFAQEALGLRERANRFYTEYQYAKAVPLYIQLADSRKPRLQDLERLADSYEKMNKYEEAEAWYARVIQDAQSSNDNYLAYASVLKQNARYEKAKKILQEYASKTGNSVSIEIAGCDSALAWMANPTMHKIVNEAGINTERAEFAAFPIQGKVYYTAEPLVSSNKSYGWTGSSFLRIYSADSRAGAGLTDAAVSTEEFNAENYHIGPISSDANGNTLYVTRTYSGKYGEINVVEERKYRTQNLELYIYKKEADGTWTETPFAYNNVQEYSLGHASLDADENTLYFASNRSGGKGGTDIWYSEKQADGSWGTPTNAGATVNTAEDELFPSIAQDGTLYYSSNGLAGMGGLDIFSSQGAKSQWSIPRNLQYPVNSAGDDFAFISTGANEQGMGGYLSSNRKNGRGSDDVYSFTSVEPKIILALKGMTYDKSTKAILPGATITLLSGGREIVAKKSTNHEGTLIFELDKNSDYKVVGQKTSYYSDSTLVSTKESTKSDTLLASLYLEPLFKVGDTFQLENIQYDFNKHNIRKDAAEILDGLVRIILDNPTLKIELSSHTDSRGSDDYNEALSQRRAQAAVDYLVTRGIARDRLVAQGYGERRLLNRCSNGVACSIAEHQTNRRIQVEVLEF